jgi:hypothetical protein
MTLREVLDNITTALKAFKPISSADITAVTTASGTIFKLVNPPQQITQASGSSTIVPAKITAGSGPAYTADIYDTFNGSVVTSGATIIPTPLNFLYAIPAGTWVQAVQVTASTFGNGGGL